MLKGKKTYHTKHTQTVSTIISIVTTIEKETLSGSRVPNTVLISLHTSPLLFL